MKKTADLPEVTQLLCHNSLSGVMNAGNRAPKTCFSALQAQQRNVVYNERSPLGTFGNTDRAYEASRGLSPQSSTNMGRYEASASQVCARLQYASALGSSGNFPEPLTDFSLWADNLPSIMSSQPVTI